MKNSSAQRSAFTLIEVVGVLATASILISLLVPKIFETLNNARLNRVLVGCQTIKTAATEHFAKFNSMASSNGVLFPVTTCYDSFDTILLKEGLIEKKFSARVGTNVLIRLVKVVGYTAETEVDPKNGNGAYDLDGDGKNDILNAQYVVEAAFYDVDAADAAALNKNWDGTLLGESGQSGQDKRGRITYNKPHPQGNWSRNLRIYLTHQ